MRTKRPFFSSRFCSFNVQGLNNPAKQKLLADDFISKGISVMMIQETKIQKQGMYEIIASNGTKFHLYNSGHASLSTQGVAILVRSDCISIKFNPISCRVCHAVVKLNNKKQVNVISAYSPTNENTKKCPEQTEKFYDELTSVINKINKRDDLVIGADFNARTKLTFNEHKLYQTNVGKYSHSEINENGRFLLDFCKIHDLKLTNTFLKQKPSHQTTWESPIKINAQRNNPYRFQIDYVIIKVNSSIKIRNSRSYNGVRTISDHKPVITDTNIKSKYRKYEHSEPKLNIKLLQNKEMQDKYHTKVDQLMTNIPESNDCQELWTSISSITKSAAEEVLGFKSKTQRENNEKVAELSKFQLKIKNDISVAKSDEQIKTLKKQRNRVMTKIHNEMKQQEKRKVENIINDLEKCPNDSRKMFDAVRNLKKFKPYSKLLLKSSDSSLTSDDQEHTEIIAHYFKNIFFTNAPKYKTINPQPMKTPFTTKEVQEAVKTMKNNKSPGCDEVYVELIKYAPTVIHENIAKICNIIAESGKYPKELIHGLLCALQKAGKSKGPPEHLRPIILLSTLRKILAIIMMKRINGRIDAAIPQSQAAYRPGRSTTEHIFATKLAIERTITSKNEEIFLILLDMTKAFDSISREKLLTDLEEIIDQDELHIMQLMLNVRLSVKCGSYQSEYFETDTGAPQGDCASANEFTLYLAKTLQGTYHPTNVQPQDHCYVTHEHQNLVEHLVDHDYFIQTKSEHLDIKQEYADDLSRLTSDNNEIQFMKENLPKILKARDLIINEPKTEEYHIARKGKCDDKWKECKLLGSLLDTEKDIERRKCLAASVIKTLKNILYSKKLSISTKVRVFDAYVAPVFLYNSELWTLSNSMNNKLDSYHRRLLRTVVLNTRYPKIVSNVDIYKKTCAKPWSIVISERRLRWVGHVSRMHLDTPARKALQYAMAPFKRKRGRPKLTWINMITKQLNEMNINLCDIFEIAKDRKEWNRVCYGK